MSAASGGTIFAERVGLDWISRSGVSMITCSSYVPGQTKMLSPGLDASTASWMEWKLAELQAGGPSPFVWSSSTQRVWLAAETGAASALTAMALSAIAAPTRAPID